MRLILLSVNLNSILAGAYILKGHVNLFPPGVSLNVNPFTAAATAT